MGTLDGKVALVTGSARKRGIGRAIALRLAREGADVVVSGFPRDPASYPEHERAEGWRGAASLADEIRALGRKAVALDCDVTQPAAVQALVDAALRELGGLDIVVNNAGVPSGAGATPIVEIDDALWQNTVDVNLTGVYHVSKLAARAMIAAGRGGAIVNISSTAGRRGIANYGAYCASKFAVIGFTQQLALELAKHAIRVNCICPGSTDTDMMDGTFRRTADHAGTQFERVKGGVKLGIPLGRQGLPEEQAAACFFLVGPDSSYITGQTLNVDGGLSMN
ncbi:MAG: SDR family oxidoreductase [Alphaproteobacteria bacterium]|nr:SDR family oxidoreductase [Alphaproteobacteria bacterium]